MLALLHVTVTHVRVGCSALVPAARVTHVSRLHLVPPVSPARPLTFSSYLQILLTALDALLEGAQLERLPFVERENRACGGRSAVFLPQTLRQLSRALLHAAVGQHALHGFLQTPRRDAVKLLQGDADTEPTPERKSDAAEYAVSGALSSVE